MNEDEVYSMAKELMKEMSDRFTITEPPRYRFNWLRQKWFEFNNPVMPTAQELRSLRSFFRGLCLLMFFSIIGCLVTGHIVLVITLVCVLLVCIPLLEWRVKVHIRDLEEGQ